MELRSLLVGSVALSIALGLAVACTTAEPSALPSSETASLSATDAGTAAGQGAALVNQLGCHGCHDSAAGVMAGNNNGIMRRVGDAGLVKVYPANLTPDSKTGLGSGDDAWSDMQIARAVRTGVDDECLTLCRVMPHFNLDDGQMADVIAYLRSLTPVQNDVSNQGCPTVDPSVSGGGQFVDAGSCPAPNDDGDASTN